ncbi:MAG: putative signaling protein [Nitrospirae bacterium]|nr:MAG: putative signaling protein [Nitrospirota bacterium]
MRSKLICVGIWFSVFYWIGDAALDVFIFHEGTITAQIFNPELFEIVVRILAICIILSFSTIAQLAINKQKKAEEERKAAFEQAENEKAKWEAIVAAIGDGITIQDRDFRIIYQNQVAINFIGNHVEEYCYMAYEGMEHTCKGCPVAMSFEDGKIHTTVRAVPTDKGMMYFENTASAVKDSEGNIIAGLEIVRDVTAPKQTEKELKKSEASYKEVAESLGATLNEVKKREEALQKGRDAFLNMLEDVTESYKELVLAYDTTIEGWSNALDYRDKETEGHSQRVTEITIEIARAAGMSEEELVHVRRGALLHDIGKLGVPDSVLLKPGKLTDEEWVLMKNHPVIAYKLLSPIAFLRRAIDIPYCHHEKWDGTGYPQGLKAEQIPLAARIFALVDVWDALRSDRPYRPAWSSEKAKDYIISLKGIQFDPELAELFFKVIDRQ